MRNEYERTKMRSEYAHILLHLPKKYAKTSGRPSDLKRGCAKIKAEA